MHSAESPGVIGAKQILLSRLCIGHDMTNLRQQNTGLSLVLGRYPELSNPNTNPIPNPELVLMKNVGLGTCTGHL